MVGLFATMDTHADDATTPPCQPGEFKLSMYMNGGLSSWESNNSLPKGPNGQIVKCYPNGTRLEVARLEDKEGGNDFLGWINMADGADQEPTKVPIYENVQHDMSLAAAYENGVKISFDTNGGTPIADKFYTTGITVEYDTLPEASKVGYTFAGWQYTPESTTTLPGKIFPELGDPIIIDSDTNLIAFYNMTFVATYTANEYTITYNLDGGQIEDGLNPNKYTYGVGVDKFAAPTKKGYKFIGWYDNDGNKITNISTEMLGDINLTAKWSKKSSGQSSSGQANTGQPNPGQPEPEQPDVTNPDVPDIDTNSESATGDNGAKLPATGSNEIILFTLAISTLAILSIAYTAKKIRV